MLILQLLTRSFMKHPSINNSEITKSYYLPRWRSITAGVILMAFGIGLNFIGFDLKNSLWDNLQWIFISFKSVGDFFFSILKLVFTAGFITGGYFFIKYADGIERARLDDKGLHYREIPKGSGAGKLGMDAGSLSFIPYTRIKDISCKKTFWAGNQIYLTLDSGLLPLTALGVLKDGEKYEIVQTVKSKIQS
jgi:hypothetical protein